MLRPSLGLLALACAPWTAFAAPTSCASDKIPSPELFGAEILSVSAVPVSGYAGNLSFCNVSVLYTHPGQDDKITVYVWLPLDGWNERFLGSGGGGYRAGSNDSVLASAVAKGYSVATTNAGHGITLTSSESWALLSPGNVNLYLLQDFASVALDDAATIGKAITASFYGVAPRFSYWSGCSTGGRQGLMLAQRYPTAYDGILAAAPAINWAKFLVAEYWPQLVMHRLGTYPPRCVFEAITDAAVEACDALDGVTDGIISAPKKCDFDPKGIVGREVACDGFNTTISEDAATIVQHAWTGARTVNGSFAWYGLNPDADLSGLVNTTCSGEDCTPTPFAYSDEWIKFFVKRDPSFEPGNMTYAEFDSVFHRSNQVYRSIISTDDPDLSEFKNAGGKMITWHGLADEVIFPDGTAQYYEQVLSLDPEARDFYQYFPAPGVGHCDGGVGPVPSAALETLRSWVESGAAPETLPARVVIPGTNTTREWNLCPYPHVPTYVGGDPNQASSYNCQNSFN